MTHHLPLPRLEHLAAEPQLASLAILEMAANVAILALAAEYPELDCIDDPLRDDELRVTLDLVELARALDFTIARYRRELLKARARDNVLLPF